MYDHEDADNKAMIQTSNKVDVTNYSKLKVTLSSSLSGLSGHTYGLYAGLSSIVIDDGFNYNGSIDDMDPYESTVKNGETVIEVDLSSITGSFYITIFAYQVDGEIVNIILE